MRKCETLKSKTASVALIVLLSGCGAPEHAATNSAKQDAGPPQPAYTGPKACDLLSNDAVTQATGKKYQSGTVESDYAYDSQCKFAPTAATDSAVLVTLHAHGDFEPYKHVPNSTPISGLGDAALWNDKNNQLAVRKGAAVFSISFMGHTKQQTAVKLGHAALEKL